ncbi:hypothetical protein [Absidia glauca]|uniref:Uncharacterized protein n=1 Tax=Absidia glauca TaxID=4829 RepID=A0A168LF33_ABSGL|nr:hypothetical protein [Absidia glauca]
MVTAALSVGTEHRHATPNHAKQKCTSATCCSPSRIWRSVQLLIGENNQQGLFDLCHDPVRGPHVLDVVVSSRLANNPALYLASNKHRVLRLDPDGVALFGKSATDLNALQMALFYRHEEVACVLLELVRDHAVARDRRLFVTHTWGKRNDSLALACYLGMAKVVKLLLEMGVKPQEVPLQCAVECRSLVEQALPTRTPPCPISSSPVNESVLKAPVQVYDGHGLDPSLGNDDPSKYAMVLYSMAQTMVLKFDREDGDADDDDDDDDEDDKDNDEDYGDGDADEVPDLVVNREKRHVDFQDGAKLGLFDNAAETPGDDGGLDLFDNAAETPGDDGGSTFPARGTGDGATFDLFDNAAETPGDDGGSTFPARGPDDGATFDLFDNAAETPGDGANFGLFGNVAETPGHDGGPSFPTRGPGDGGSSSLPGPGDDGSSFPMIETLFGSDQGALLSSIEGDPWSSNSSGGTDLHESAAFEISTDDPDDSFGDGDSSILRQHFPCGGQVIPVARLVSVGDGDPRSQQRVDDQQHRHPFISTIKRQQHVDDQQRQDHPFTSTTMQQQRIDNQQSQISPGHSFTSTTRHQQRVDDQHRQHHSGHPFTSTTRLTRQQQFYDSWYLDDDMGNDNISPPYDSSRSNQGTFTRMALDSIGGAQDMMMQQLLDHLNEGWRSFDFMPCHTVAVGDP